MMNNIVPVLAASTAQIEQRVQLFQLLGTIFTAVALIFFAVSLFLFFWLDIRTVIGEKTGRIEKKSIAEMEEATAQSGKLQSVRNAKKNKKDDADKLDIQELFQPRKLEEGPVESVPMSKTEENSTTVLQIGENDTTVLDRQVHYEGPDDAPTESLLEARTADIGKFVIIKNIMLIHTDEYI